MCTRPSPETPCSQAPSSRSSQVVWGDLLRMYGVGCPSAQRYAQPNQRSIIGARTALLLSDAKATPFAMLPADEVANGRPFNVRRWALVHALGIAGLLELRHRRDDAHSAGGSACIDVVLALRLRERGLTQRVYSHLFVSLQQDPSCALGESSAKSPPPWSCAAVHPATSRGLQRTCPSSPSRAKRTSGSPSKDFRVHSTRTIGEIL